MKNDQNKTKTQIILFYKKIKLYFQNSSHSSKQRKKRKKFYQKKKKILLPLIYQEDMIQLFLHPSTFVLTTNNQTT